MQEIITAKRELKEIHEVVMPIKELFIADKDNTRPLTNIVKEVLGCMKLYIRDMAKAWM